MQSVILHRLILTFLGFLIISVSAGRRLGMRDKVQLENTGPFVLLYEHEAFRGKEYVQFFLKKGCIPLPERYRNWTSSVDTHRSCVTVCKDLRCGGPCKKVFSNQGISRLSQVGFNDNIQSVKACYN